MQTRTIATLPHIIYAKAFDFDGTDIRVDRDGKELADFKAGLQKMMQVAISKSVTDRLLPCQPLPPKTKPAHNSWLITGNFTRVEQGSRLLRGSIGFGLGATKLECHTKPPTELLSFATTGGSNAEPGAITAFATDPLTLALELVSGGAGNVSHGLTEDTSRTGRVITAELSDYMYKNHLIPKDKWLHPKRTSDY